MPFIAFLMIVLALPIAAWGADSTKPETPTLTVTATGSLPVAPDTAFVTVGMETAGKSLAEAERQNSAVMQKVMGRFRELKIDKERIQTSSFTVTPQYKLPPKRPSDAPPSPPEIIGYRISNTVTVEVRDLEKVATVIEGALTAEANHFQGLQWALRDEQQARLSALKIAAGKAREKATVLSEALNVKLVRLVTVNEGGHVIRPMPYAARPM
ncbi:MAG: SIMPL domain-containing protein, partial [Terriglobia bacterium]